MATRRPPIDPEEPIVHCAAAYCEPRYFHGKGFEVNANAAVREFNDYHKRPLVCAVMACVKSGNWGMGTTQDSIANSLGLDDRSWVSDAINDGWMSLDIFARFLNWPLKPTGWNLPLGDWMKSNMNRHGFIGAAQSYAQFVNDRPTLASKRMDPLDYELMCEIFTRIGSWPVAFVEGDVSAAAAIVSDVCRDKTRDVCPLWFSPARRLEAQAKIQRLTADASTAYAHLSQLYCDWFDVFVVTDEGLEFARSRRRNNLSEDEELR